jgi:hypothetical protein
MHRLLPIALVACGAAPRPPHPAPPAAPVVQVTIRHLDDADAWEVRYQLPAPIREIEFSRPGYPLRDRWSVVGPPGVTLARTGDHDVVRAAAPVREVVLRIATYVEQVEKDYEVFLPYAGGGHLVYTGQFDLASPGGAPALEHEYALVPRAGEHVVVEGRVATGPTRWKARGDGTYAYFGTVQPVHTAAVIGVIDPALPGWLRSRVETLVPKLFELYSRALGAPLAERPVVFVGYFETKPRNRSLGGGSLPGVVQMQFGLPPDIAVDGELAGEVAHLIAHESAHLWNSQRFRRVGQNSDWLHEGGADAFAWRALLALGEIDDARYGRELSRAASLCVLGLAGEPLHASSRPGRYKNHYRCGATISLLVEAALRASGARDGLFAWWARVFAARGDGTYDERAFLDALRAIDGAAPRAPRHHRRDRARVRRSRLPAAVRLPRGERRRHRRLRRIRAPARPSLRQDRGHHLVQDARRARAHRAARPARARHRGPRRLRSRRRRVLDRRRGAGPRRRPRGDRAVHRGRAATAAAVHEPDEIPPLTAGRPPQFVDPSLPRAM